MDGLETLIVNMGFAVGVAAFLIKWMTGELNKKLDKIIEIQEQIVQTQQEIVATQRQIAILLERRND